METIGSNLPSAARAGALEGNFGTPGEWLDGRRAIETVVEVAFGNPALRLREGADRTRRAVFVRQVAMYLMHVGCGASMERVGKEFGRDRSTVGHACRVVEDLRDEAALDGLLDCLERAAVALAEALEIRRVHGRRLP